MKKLLLLLIGVVTLVSASAQTPAEINPVAPVPVDPEVRVGTLANGMTYYIRHNEKPKQQANFYIWHNVGAVQESDAQQGLAHFLEHMAFNGIKSMPGKTMIEYLERRGVRFGGDLNAGTWYDYTTYNINNVPTDKPGLIDTTLLILHDWSAFIDLQPKEVDAERGVISEELRGGDNASRRSQEALLDALYRGSKYPTRNVIGHLDGLASFEFKEIEDFYHTWYRPEYQAIVIVGDLDVDAVEAKLVKLMADIPASKPGLPVKETYPVPDNEEPRVVVFSDPEHTRSKVATFYRRQAPPKEVNGLMMRQMIDAYDMFASYIFSLRILEAALQPNAPFLSGGMMVGDIVGMARAYDHTLVSVVARDGEIARAFEAMMTEVEKMRRYGFTQGELDRAKSAMLANIENVYASREDRTNAYFVQVYLDNFTLGMPMLTAEESYRIDKQMVEMITLEDLNAWAAALITEKNQAIFAESPAKKGVEIPTAEELLAINAAVRTAKIEGYVDIDLSRPLIPAGTKLKGSKVKTETVNTDLGVTEWTLKNGIRVRVKPTTLKADEVQFVMTAKGGIVSLPTEQMQAASLLSQVVNTCGIGDFTGVDLKKKLEDKTSAINLYVASDEHGMSGWASPKDLETMLQVMYMGMTDVRWDKDAFDVVTGQVRQWLRNAMSNPDYIMSVERQKTRFGDSPRRQMMSLEELEKIKFEMMPAIAKTFYADASDFTFTFVGNVDLATLKPLVEKYIGSLPVAKDGMAEYTDDGVRMATGTVTNEFRTPMIQPKVSEDLLFHAKADAFTIKNNVTLLLLRQVLNVRYMNEIREEKGGTYGVAVRCGLNYRPEPEFTLSMDFDTNDKMADELTEIIVAELRAIAENGPIAQDLENGKHFLLKGFETGLESNDVWFSIMRHYYETSHENMFANYKSIVESVTSDDVKALAQKLLDSKNLIHVEMRPQAE